MTIVTITNSLLTILHTLATGNSETDKSAYIRSDSSVYTYFVARPNNSVEQDQSGWKYEKSGGQAGKEITKASLTSTNLIAFPYPYNSRERITLGIRSRDGDNFAYLEVSQGLLTRSFQGGKAEVKFDSQKPVTFTLSAAANGRGNIVFFDTESAFIKRLKTAKNTVIKMYFAGQDIREMHFKTAGLQWK